jgi:hypothetical protein
LTGEHREIGHSSKTANVGWAHIVAAREIGWSIQYSREWKTGLLTSFAP